MKAILPAATLVSALLCFGQQPQRQQPQQGSQQPPPAQSSQSSSRQEPGTLTGKLNGTAGQNAVLTFTEVNTGEVHKVTTSGDGSFSLALPPGVYRVQTEKDGIVLAARQTMLVNAGTTFPLTVAFDSDNIQDTVYLTAEAPALQTEPPEIGRGYDTRFVRSLPFLTRNPIEMMPLMPGVSLPQPVFPIQDDPQRSQQFHVNGLPNYMNDIILDGISIREPFTGVIQTRVPSIENIQNFNIVTSNPPADTGFLGSAMTSMVTRPGTNGVHGSLFGFWNNSFLSARNALQPASLGGADFRNWNYGGTLGGAIVPNRTFLFGSYEGRLFSGSQLQFGTVPTPAVAAGDFSGTGVTIFDPQTGLANGFGRTPFLNNVIPSNRISPLGATISSNLPAPNAALGFGNNFAANVPFDIRSNLADGRFDQRIGDHSSIFARYGINYVNSTANSLFGPIIGTTDRSGVRNNFAAADYSTNWGRLLATFRVGYNRYRNQIDSTSAIGPGLNIAGLGLLGSNPNLPAKMIDNNYQGNGIFNTFIGRHQLQFGAEVRDLNSRGFNNFLFGPQGTFYFGPGATSVPGAAFDPNAAFLNSYAGLLLGAPTVSGSFLPIQQPNYHQRLYSAFLSDIVHVNQRLALDLGVRYEVYSPVTSSRGDGFSIFSPATGTTSTTGTIGSYRLTNVAPRVGVAYRVAERTVVRASYAINYFPIPFSLLGINPTGTGLTQGVLGTFNTVPFSIPSTANLASNVPAAVNSHGNTPYVQQYYFMVQQGLPMGFVIDASYVGNTGRRLPFLNNINVAAPGTGLAGLPFAGVGQTAPVIEAGSGLTSNFNALQVNMTKRLTKSAAFAVAYQFGKALDYGNGLLLNPFNRQANYGPADWDQTHMLTISHLFTLPIGTGQAFGNTGVLGKILGNWQLNGIFHYRTGTPYTVTSDSLACGCAGIGSVIGPGALGFNPNGAASFAPGLVGAPVPNQFGTLGRNSLRGPDNSVYNVSLFKQFPMSENSMVELRGEVYNIFNTTQWGTPFANSSFGNFGTPTVASTPRLFLLGARVLF